MITHRTIPHLRIVVGACMIAIVGYAFFSIYAVVWLKDPALTGDIIGTWKSFAVLAFGFWIGSSSGGKENKDEPAGTKEDPIVTKTEEPQEVDVISSEQKPVHTKTSKGSAR